MTSCVFLGLRATRTSYRFPYDIRLPSDHLPVPVGVYELCVYALSEVLHQVLLLSFSSTSSIPSLPHRNISLSEVVDIRSSSSSEVVVIVFLLQFIEGDASPRFVCLFVSFS